MNNFRNHILVIFLLVFLFLNSSCSLLLKEAYDENNNRINLLPQPKTRVYCKAQESKVELLGPDKKNGEEFLKFLKSNEKMPEAEIFTLWILLHLNLRPEKVSLPSHVKFFESQFQNIEFREFNSGQTPLLFALNDLLKRHHSKQTVEKLDQFLKKNYRHHLYVDDDFEKFLETKKEVLWSFKELRDSLFKDNQPLKAGETLSFIKTAFNPSSKGDPIALAQNLSSQKSFFCDHDQSLYSGPHEKIMTTDENVPKPLLLGLKISDHLFFMIIDQELKIGTENSGLFHANGIAPTKNTPFCFFPLEKSQLILTASHIRDPEQILKLISHKIDKNFSTKEEIALLLSYPRQLTLTHPTRILIEADNTRLSQSKDKDLENLFKGQYPIYQANQLGLVNAIFIENTQKESGIVTDKRFRQTINCFK